MNDIENTSKLVKTLLENDPKARNSDNYLFYEVCRMKLAEQYIDIEFVSFKEIMLQYKQLGLPKFETVRRTRQKLQHDYPELSSSESVGAAKAILEEQYKEYARS